MLPETPNMSQNVSQLQGKVQSQEMENVDK